MTRRERKLTLVLGALVVVGAVVYFIAPPTFTAPPDPVAPKHYVISDALKDEFRKIRAAETNPDTEQRCLAMPDLAEFSWNPKLVAAMCHLHARKMIAWKELNDAIGRRDAAFLKQTFDGYLEQSFQRGQHGFIGWTYWYMFRNASKENLETTTKWIDLDPESAYAWAARGAHYVSAAYDARGGAFVADTPPENFRRMHELVGKAKADLDKAIELNPRLIAVHLEFLRIAQLTGDDELRHASVRKALAVDPDDQQIYDHWIDASEPKWGGSMAAMERAADKAAEHAAANPLLSRARGRPSCYAAMQAACRSCGTPPDYPRALRLFRQSAAFGPTRCFLENAAWSALQAGDELDAVRYYTQGWRFLNDGEARINRADVLYRIGEREWAFADMDALLKDYPDYIKALNEKAYLVEMDGRPREAEPLYRHALEVDPKNERAALQLARLYLSKLPDFDKAEPLVTGLLERSPKLARAWLYKAALARGNEEACREALRNYLDYVDRNDTYEKDDIVRATARLKQLEAKKA